MSTSSLVTHLVSACLILEMVICISLQLANYLEWIYIYLPTDGLIIITRVARQFMHISFPKPLTRTNILNFILHVLLGKCKKGVREWEWTYLWRKIEEKIKSELITGDRHCWSARRSEGGDPLWGSEDSWNDLFPIGDRFFLVLHHMCYIYPDFMHPKVPKW